jgi:acyl-CoA thioester hydrolase
MDSAQPPQTLNKYWDHPDPFVVPVVVQPDHIDELGHTNNVHYLEWLHQCAWQHSAAVGLPSDAMLATGYAMAVREVHMTYLGATFAGDQLWVGDWLTHNDSKLRATRHFQILRETDKACVMRADIHYICIDVTSGRPKRMPASFVAAYPSVTG